MKPLSRLWTWIGQSFVPVAFGWAFWMQGGLSTALPERGVVISWAYWGILITLAAGAALTWTAVIYAKLARRSNQTCLLPANTMFEEETERNALISWMTAATFALVTVAALIVFSVVYSESLIHRWDDKTPVSYGFWQSRAVAHTAGCSGEACFAVFSRFDQTGKMLSGVNEYILYVTDGSLIVLVAAIITGLAFWLLSSSANGGSRADRVRPETS